MRFSCWGRGRDETPAGRPRGRAPAGVRATLVEEVGVLDDDDDDESGGAGTEGGELLGRGVMHVRECVRARARATNRRWQQQRCRATV